MLKVGILGSGQLAKMLIEHSSQLDLKFKILTKSDQDPAVIEGVSYVLGKVEDPRSLKELFENSDKVTFENEFVSVDLLENGALSLSKDDHFFVPSLKSIKILQNKLNQKKLLKELSISSPTYQVINLKNKETIKDSLLLALKEFGSECVLKWAQFGYDGYGNYFLKIPNDLDEAINFCEKANLKKISVFVEKKIDFKSELAMTACRGQNGQIVYYPLVESQQVKGTCKWVKGPYADIELENTAKKFIEKILTHLDYVGTFAMELFLTHDHQILVNELAPRVHNTTHYSQDACQVSQFENHMRAVIGSEVLQPGVKGNFVMMNLLSQVLSDQVITPSKSEASEASVFLHWYGKKNLKPGRKMGHLNAVTQNKTEIESFVLKMKKIDENWLKQIKTLESKDS